MAGGVPFAAEDLLVKIPTSLKLFLSSVGVGIIAAVALGAVAFALSPFFDAVGLYIMPARLMVPVLGPIVPSRLTYWLAADGGAAAGVLLIIASVILFWTVCFGGLYFAWATSRHRRAAPETIAS